MKIRGGGGGGGRYDLHFDFLWEELRLLLLLR
jgi:hypothetical protein